MNGGATSINQLFLGHHPGAPLAINVKLGLGAVAELGSQLGLVDLDLVP